MTAPDPGLDILERRVRRSQSRMMPFGGAVLMWERLWPCLWPISGIIGTFIALALFDVLPLLPFWLHSVILLGFAGAGGVALYRGLRSFRAPTRQEIRSRIEIDSQLHHRPLAALADEISGQATGNGEQDVSRALWCEHRRRAAQACKRLRLGVPSPGLARIDPYGIRAVILLLIVISVAAGGSQAPERLARAMLPENRDFSRDTRVDLWVTPPAYTGISPFHVFLDKADAVSDVALESEADKSDEPAEVYTIPVGSTILAQVAGAPEPTLAMATREVAFDSINAAQGDAADHVRGYGETGYRLQTVVGFKDVQADVTIIAVHSDGREISSWPVRVVDDLAPHVEFTQAPSNIGRGRLRIAFAAEDDFGLNTASLVIRNPAIPADSMDGDTVRLNLPLSLPLSSFRPLPTSLSASSDGAVSIETAVLRDLSEHDWSGLLVELRLEASDALGQIGRSDSLEMVLPERIFNHPVARALSDYRKRLVALPVGNEVETVLDVVDGLDDLSSRPEHFNQDQVVYLALRVARARLSHSDLFRPNSGWATLSKTFKSVRSLLWRTALHIEDGEFALAGRELSDVQEALEQALRDGAFTEAVERLLNAMDQALDRYLAALDDQLVEKGMQDISDIPGLSFMDEADLKQLIKDARALAQTGSIEAAQATLDELQGLLQAIENAMNSDQPMDQFAEIREMMQALSGISTDQQKLLDQTFRQMRRASGLGGDVQMESGESIEGFMEGAGESAVSGEAPPEDVTRNYARPQGDIRRQLSELMLGLDGLIGMLPESMLEAKDAMGRAVESLQVADPAGAVSHQGEALEALQRATEQINEQVASRLRALPGNMPAMQGSTSQDGIDPFGRMGGGAMGRFMDDGTVKVPSQMEMRRAREIYKELRRRAGNLKRPVMEREYIHRLLRQF